MIPRFELILLGLGFFGLVGLLLGWLAVAVFRVLRRTPWGVRALRGWRPRATLLEPWSGTVRAGSAAKPEGGG